MPEGKLADIKPLTQEWPEHLGLSFSAESLWSVYLTTFHEYAAKSRFLGASALIGVTRETVWAIANLTSPPHRAKSVLHDYISFSKIFVNTVIFP